MQPLNIPSHYPILCIHVGTYTYVRTNTQIHTHTYIFIARRKLEKACQICVYVRVCAPTIA